MVVTIRIVARAFFFLGVIAVAWLSLAPQDTIPDVETWDKLRHFLAYAMLAVFGGLAYWARRIEVAMGVLLVAYGCILEIARIYVPGRSGTIEDAIADGHGAMFGVGIVRILRRYFTKRVVGV